MRGRRLVGLGMLLLTVACGGERSLFAPDYQPGGSGRPVRDPAVVGTWQAVLLISVETDLQTWTTTWRFDADGRCLFTRVVRSVLEGVDRTTALACTWRTANASIAVTYTDWATTAELPYTFASSDPDRLVLEGVEYSRVSR
jgi:hypothetical protein